MELQNFTSEKIEFGDIIFYQTLGYSIAFLSILVTIATWVDRGETGRMLVKQWGLVISPNMYGGEISKTIDQNGYKVVLHEPVFQGLFKPKKKGFIQVDVFKGENAPSVIDESIDFDDDGKNDFRIMHQTRTDHIKVESYNSNVAEQFTKNKYLSGYSLRLYVTNPDY